MAEQLKGSYEQLEQRVVERTEELTASELRYRDLFEESRDAIFITTPNGRFIDLNRAALDLFGSTREEITESEVRANWFDPRGRERYLKEFDDAGSVNNFEMKVLRKDGTILDCEVSAILRRGDSDSEARIQGIVRDVTESKQAGGFGASTAGSGVGRAQQEVDPEDGLHRPIGTAVVHAHGSSKRILVNQGERLVSENLGPTSLQALSLLRRHQELGLPEALLRVSYSEHPPLPRPGAAPTTFYYIIPTLPQAGEGFLRTNQ